MNIFNKAYLLSTISVVYTWITIQLRTSWIRFIWVAGISLNRREKQLFWNEMCIDFENAAKFYYLKVDNPILSVFTRFRPFTSSPLFGVETPNEGKGWNYRGLILEFLQIQFTGLFSHTQCLGVSLQQTIGPILVLLAFCRHLNLLTVLWGSYLGYY